MTEPTAAQQDEAPLVARLLDVVTRLGADAPPQVLLRHLATSAVELLGAAGSAFVDLDRGSGRLTVQAIAHLPAGLLGLDFPMEGSALQELATSGRRSLTGPASRFPHLNAEAFPLGQAHLAVAVTTVAGVVTGGLYVSLRPGDALSARQLEVLELLAGHAGIALQHAQVLAEVRRARLQREAVVEAMADGLAVLDADGRVTSWNAALVAMTGLPAARALGSPAPLPVPAPGDTLEHELADGRWLEILVSLVPASDDRVLSVRDISAAKELEAAKDLFLRTAGHELRTPLTVLRGSCETLLHRWDRLDDAARRELVSTVLARTRGMGVLVEQLLRGSAAERGEPEPATTFDLAATCRLAVAGVAASSPGRTWAVTADGPVPACGQEAVVEAVLDQLLENAGKHSPPGAPVQVMVAAERDRAVLRVADRGPGISAHDRERVFERFVRVGPAAVPGVGLGLWIVRRYVDAQGGTVRALPRPGGGTVVEVTLPAGAWPAGA